MSTTATKAKAGGNGAATAAKPRARAAGKAATAELEVRRLVEAANLLKMAGDPTRLRFLLLLSAGEQHVGSLCEQLGMSQPAISHHLAITRHSGVVEPRRVGKNNYYFLTDKGRLLVDAITAVL